MKTVGKQLQEARLARNWTPELAARETKIKVDRLGDLERDDYSHFTSPTYARGFVRTYARALGLDEYRILRQLDNKLPDDDSANIDPHAARERTWLGVGVGLVEHAVIGDGALLDRRVCNGFQNICECIHDCLVSYVLYSF